MGILYNDSIGGQTDCDVMIDALTYSASGVNFGFYRKNSDTSNILGALGTFSTIFGLFDKWSGYASGGFEAGFKFVNIIGIGAEVCPPILKESKGLVSQ